jgi:chemotaxis protein MotB
VSNSGDRPIVIVKRYKKVAGGHHGGAWKVAYADFVTAMMAFFMVMWLVASVNDEQRSAIFDYFNNPSMEQGKSTTLAPGQNGPGGSSTSAIDMGGGLDAPKTADKKVDQVAAPITLPFTTAKAGAKSGEEKELERKRLETLKQQLEEAIGKTPSLEPFRDQLLIDIMPEGLRIQIVDGKNRPMFDLGGANLKDYTIEILKELSRYLNTVSNRLTITGHTDATAYVSRNGYTNWELSTDRANAARRALAQSGLKEEKIARIVGLGSAVLFDKADPLNPINRRISIIVMTKEADDDSLKVVTQGTPLEGEQGIVPAEGAPVAELPVAKE